MFSRVQSAPTGVTALRQASSHYSKIKTLPNTYCLQCKHCNRGGAGATATRNMLIYSRSVFSDQHVLGFIPSSAPGWKLKQAGRPSPTAPFGASPGSISRTSSAVIHIRDSLQPEVVELLAPLFPLYNPWIWLILYTSDIPYLYGRRAALSGEPHLEHASRFKQLTSCLINEFS